MVPQEVPMEVEMKQETTNMPMTMRWLGRRCRAMSTAASTAPMPLAMVANAPERMKMRHMIMMFASPMPWAKTSTRFASVSRWFSSIATAEATRNATGIGVR